MDNKMEWMVWPISKLQNASCLQLLLHIYSLATSKWWCCGRGNLTPHENTISSCRLRRDQAVQLVVVNMLVAIALVFFLCSTQILAQSCDNGLGVCIDVDTQECNGMLKKGYCSGPANIICCEKIACDSNKGVCIDSSLQQCGGTLKSGYCPGASGILCCEPGSDLPARCSGSGPPLPPSTYEFTLKSQGSKIYDILQFQNKRCSRKGFPNHPGALVYVPSTFDPKSTEIVS